MFVLGKGRGRQIGISSLFVQGWQGKLPQPMAQLWSWEGLKVS